MCGYCKITGRNFYELTEKAAESICVKFGTTSLKRDKKEPEFMKYFGWCTWDAFYHSVSPEKILEGLENFKQGGFVPKFLLIDDGWQTTEPYVTEGIDPVSCRLYDFKVNKKFKDFKNSIQEIKEIYGVEKIFVWHALMGYWSGVDVSSPVMAKYNPKISNCVHPWGIKAAKEESWNGEKRDMGIISPDMAECFYNDYHSYLKSVGIDGIKVDSQATLDSARVNVNRCEWVKTLHEGLEKSASKNFGGELINCMSCSNDVIYHVKNSNMMRSSDDFMPTKPETHILHIYDNAVNSIWMSEFTCCDWDMFQTTHEYGKYHAAARAISGGPVYVSDKVGEHNFDIIKALTNDDGEILRCIGTAKPAEDSLFVNISKGNTPFKIFNKNKYGGVVVVFSSAVQGEKQTVCVKARDVDGFENGEYVLYSHETKMAAKNEIEISVGPKEYDIVTVAKIEKGIAVIGIAEKLNGGGAIENVKATDNGIEVTLSCTGTLVVYSGKPLNYKTTGDGFYYIEVDKMGKIILEG